MPDAVPDLANGVYEVKESNLTHRLVAIYWQVILNATNEMIVSQTLTSVHNKNLIWLFY